jgi:hypothetical protein
LKQSKILRLVLPLVLVASFGCASADGAGRSGQGPVLDLASLLNGSWQAEGSDLRLEIGSTGSSLTSGAYNLFASASGQAGDRTVNERAVIFLEAESGGVEMTVVPRFDPTVTELSDVTEVSAAELRAACTLTLAPTQTGYSGESLGGEACVRAVQGAVGRWNIEVTRETLRLYGSGDQQLVFRRAGDGTRPAS